MERTTQIHLNLLPLAYYHSHFLAISFNFMLKEATPILTA